jgi:phosphoglycerol transferase MdoB-like AlkP superfamily enzyme
MQEFVINRKIAGKEITPNLNKLISDSLYFDNLHYQIGAGNTSDAEFLSNTSLYPAKEGSVYYRFTQNTYDSLPRILKEQSYESYAMHAFTAGFWNRTEMYQTLGFDKFVNGDDYIPDDFEGWNGDALSDASFFRQSVEKFDSSNPFYAFMITLSSHHPFNDFENHDFYTAEFEGTYIGNYMKAAHYADKCIGEFVDDLEKRGILENTLLVLYGDHSAVPKHLAGQMMDLLNMKYSELEWTKLQKVPLIIHYPGLKNGEKVSTTGGQIDILPTIANLMGFEAPYAIGKDLLNTQKGYAVLRNGTVITDDYVFLNDTGETFDIKTGSALKKKDYEKEISSYLEELTISDLIIEKDALKYWHLQSNKK